MLQAVPVETGFLCDRLKSAVLGTAMPHRPSIIPTYAYGFPPVYFYQVKSLCIFLLSNACHVPRESPYESPIEGKPCLQKRASIYFVKEEPYSILPPALAQR